MKCELEIFVDGAWRVAARFESVNDDEIPKGYRGRAHFTYEEDYAIAALAVREPRRLAVSCGYPVSFALHTAAGWPAFLLDILPAGAGRRSMLRELGMPDSPAADWPLLLRANNPPGNVRVHTSTPAPTDAHEGFAYEDVLARGEGFIEYAHGQGAPVAGSLGAQGDAPKFLLTQDHHGRWHADGALSDARAAKHWLVKFPRGRQDSDRSVLRNEAAYMRVAQQLGVRVLELPRFDNNALFVPRFDRRLRDGKVERFGLESLCSAAGVADYGVSIGNERLCAAIRQFCTSPAHELRELVRRDVLNVALGNTDNHARNTSLLKYPNGKIELSPLYDFAPMILDEQGIARICRWEGAENMGFPDWGRVAELIAGDEDATDLRVELAIFATSLEPLRDVMARAGVDDWLIERLDRRITEVTDALRAARPATWSAPT